jgi:hypothetical protein
MSALSKVSAFVVVVVVVGVILFKLSFDFV